MKKITSPPLSRLIKSGMIERAGNACETEPSTLERSTVGAA